MKQHFLTTSERHGVIRVTTLCGRQNMKANDGTNGVETAQETTCKFCLKLLDRRAAQ